MRIAYLLPDPGIPVGGVKGASVHVAEVCRALAEAGATVRLLAMRAAAAPPPGVELDVFPCPAIPSGPSGDDARRSAVASFLRWAEERLEGARVDLVYERLSLFAGSGGELAERIGARRIVEVNAPVAAERAGRAGLSLAAEARDAERAALAGATAFAVSPPMAAWSLERGAAAARVVVNGVDGRRFAPARSARAGAAIRRDLGIADAEVVGFVGSMKPWHGVGTLLDAVAILAPRRPALRALVVGDGPGLADLRSRAAAPDLAGRCRLVGPVASPEIPAHLAAMDVAVAPYLPPLADAAFYFSPLKVVEAMAAARPVVASSFESIAHMLGGTGRLVPPGDARRLAQAIDEVLSDPEAARAAGSAARRRAVEQFSWAGVADEIIAAALPTTTVPGGPRDGRGR